MKALGSNAAYITAKHGLIGLCKTVSKEGGKYGIRAMPTLMLFKNGQVAAQHTGALVQKKKLEDWINSANVA